MQKKKNQLKSHRNICTILCIRYISQMNDAYQMHNNDLNTEKKCSSNCPTTKYLRKNKAKSKKIQEKYQPNCEQNNYYIILKEKSLVTVFNQNGGMLSLQWNSRFEQMLI